MTKKDLLDALDGVPDFAPIYFVDKSRVRGTRAKYHDGELCKLRDVKIQKDDFAAVTAIVFSTETRKELVQAKTFKIILT